MKKYIIIGTGAVLVILGFVLFSDVLSTNFYTSNEVELDPNLSIEDVNKLTPPEQSTTGGETKEINNLDKKKIMNATLQTNKGDIKIEFYDEAAPKTVENFIKLANSKFYDGVKFHRVIKGFMIQTGDPLSKDDGKASLWGTGGPGYKFADEIDESSDLYTKMGYKKGVVAMANSGPNTNGSQFFIMHVDTPLPPLYTIFGRVVSGQDVVDQIALVKTLPGDRPVDPVIIQSIKVE